jgi:subtilase family serine protease
MTVGVATAAAHPHSQTMVRVSQGSGTAPLLAGTDVGPTAKSTQIDLSFILRSPRLQNLESRVAAGWDGPFLTTAQFANQYGQTPAVVHGIEHYLAGFGITTSAYADRLDISAHGTAAQINRALGVSLRNFRVRSPKVAAGGHSHMTTVHGSLRNPEVPKQFANSILAILGLSSYKPFVSSAIPATRQRIHPRKVSGSGIPAGNGLSPANFVSRYHLGALESQGAKGQGETIGIVTLAAMHAGTALTFWNKFLHLNEPASRLKLVRIDGGGPAPSGAIGTNETDLDVEQSGAIAPAAHVRVYEAPNTDPGFADAWYRAASDNIADTVSSSWGSSDTAVQQAIAQGKEAPAYAATFDEVFAELGAQGQSDFTSTADEGAYVATADAGTTNLSTDLQADSPYITAAGGTTLPGRQTYLAFNSAGKPTGGTVSIDIPAERAWSWDYFFPFFKQFGVNNKLEWAEENLAGGTGGYSALEPRPAYQGNVSAFNDRRYLTATRFRPIAPGLTEPTNFRLTLTPPLRAGSTSTGRATPDVSTNGDPQTGYAVFDPELFEGGFAQFGGTSFVAPQLNGSTAVIDSSLGHRVGFWNPQIYGFARSSTSPFQPLNDTRAYRGVKFLSQTSKAGVTTAVRGEFSNNNLFYTGKRGKIWNPATGLGVPNLTALAGDFGHTP